jgi:hypothetical protein
MIRRSLCLLAGGLAVERVSLVRTYRPDANARPKKEEVSADHFACGGPRFPTWWRK